MIELTISFEDFKTKNSDLDKWKLDYFNEKTNKLRLIYTNHKYPSKTIDIILKYFKLTISDFTRMFIDNCWVFTSK